MMLRGYNDSHKAYKLVDVNSQTNTTCLSCDVVVDESAMLFQKKPDIKLDMKIAENEEDMAKKIGSMDETDQQEVGVTSQHDSHEFSSQEDA
jgi:hypothetical protein